MKKTIILLCVIVALLLAGCGREPESAGTVDSTETAVNPAKTFSLKVPPEDRNQAFNRDCVETEEGFYYIFAKETADSYVNLIYFCPRGGDSFYPLCGKPNCKHEDENCNAYAGDQLGYYNGALYTIDNIHGRGICLVKMNPDGTDHQEVARVDPSGGANRYIYQCEYHHGKFFLMIYPDPSLPLEEQRGTRMIVIDLSDYTQTEPAADFFQSAETVPDMIVCWYKDKLYGGVDDLDDEDPLLIELNAVTGEARTLSPGYFGSFYATDSTLYYFVEDMSYLSAMLGREVAQGKPGFRELNLETGEVRECGMPVEGILNALYDEDFIYATDFNWRGNTDSTVYFLSRDYKPVDQIDLKDGMCIAAVTSDRVYFSGMRTNTPISHYIDKAQIGSGELTLVPIQTIG